MQVSKERFRQLIREEVETHLSEQKATERIEAQKKQEAINFEARIRVNWLNKTFMPAGFKGGLNSLDYSEKSYRKLYDTLEYWGFIKKPLFEENMLLEAPPRDAGGMGAPFPTEYDKSEARRYEKKYGSQKPRPLPQHHLPTIRDAIKFGRKYPPWVRMSIQKSSKNWIPPPSAAVCESMSNLLGGKIVVPSLVNHLDFFNNICLDRVRHAAGERPGNTVCGDFKKEAHAYREDRETVVRQAWKELGLVNLCNWPIPLYGMDISSDVQRALPLIYMPEVMAEAAYFMSDTEGAKGVDFYFESTRTQAIRSIQHKLEQEGSLEEQESEILYLLMMHPKTFLPALGAKAILMLYHWIADESEELTDEQYQALQQSRERDAGPRSRSPIPYHQEGEPKDAPDVAYEKFGCRLLPDSRPLTPFDLARFEESLIDKPWGKNEWKDLETYASARYGDPHASPLMRDRKIKDHHKYLIKQYRVAKKDWGVDYTDYIPGKWPTTPEVKQLLKIFRYTYDLNAFEKCIRKSPHFKKEYGEKPIGFLAGPQPKEERDLESCREIFSQARGKGALERMKGAYREKTGRDLPSGYPQYRGARGSGMMYIWNKKCLKGMCHGGNKLACKILKK